MAADYARNKCNDLPEVHDVRKKSHMLYCFGPPVPLRSEHMGLTDEAVDMMEVAVAELTETPLPKHTFRRYELVYGPFAHTYQCLYGSPLEERLGATPNLSQRNPVPKSPVLFYFPSHNP